MAVVRSPGGCEASQPLAGRELDVVRVVGGGSQDHLLCQLTADACGLPVLAGPAEAAALPDLAAMRDLLRRTHDVQRHDPRTGLDWQAADERVPRPGEGEPA